MSRAFVGEERPIDGQAPVRLLIVAHSSHRGGAEYCLDTTLRYLDRSRLDPTVVFPFDGPMAAAARGYGLPVRIEPLMYWLYCDKSAWYWKNLLGRSWANVRTLYRTIGATGAQLVYTNTSAIFESAIAAKIAGIPHLWHVHEVLDDNADLRSLLPRRLLRRFIDRFSDRVVFESQASRRIFGPGPPSNKLAVVYNSVRWTGDAPIAGQESLWSQLNLRADDCVVGFVGQFIDRKNPLLLIRALTRLKSIPRLKCVFVGDGPLAEEMRCEITRLQLDDFCRIVPFQHDITVAMSAIDFLVLPSRQESFGLVLVEAASMEKPAIACRSQGPDEIIDEGKTGWLVPQQDEAALAAAIERLACNQVERLRMGHAAARRAKQMFCPLANTRKLEEIMLSMLAAGPAKGNGATAEDNSLCLSAS